MDLAHLKHWLWRTGAYLLIVLVAAFSFAAGRHRSHQNCMAIENTNAALRAALDARIQDPTTPQVVKDKFRRLEREKLLPRNC